MLGGSPDVFSTGELTHGNERLRCGDWHKGEECPFWTDEFKRLILKNKKVKNKIIKKRAKDIFGSKVILNPDKFPHFYKNSLKNGDCVDFIIVLFKRPHAFSYSFLEHQKKRIGVKLKSSVRRERLILRACADYYGTYTSGINLIRSNGIPHIYASYEKLASNPEHVLRRVCKRIGAAFSSDMIEYWKNSDALHMVPSGNAGARYQFLNRDKYDRIWKSRLDDNHNTYGRQHAKWLLDNYQKIKLDEKWRLYLSGNEIRIINSHKKSNNIYMKMMKNSV